MFDSVEGQKGDDGGEADRCSLNSQLPGSAPIEADRLEAQLTALGYEMRLVFFLSDPGVDEFRRARFVHLGELCVDDWLPTAPGGANWILIAVQRDARDGAAAVFIRRKLALRSPEEWVEVGTVFLPGWYWLNDRAAKDVYPAYFSGVQWQRSSEVGNPLCTERVIGVHPIAFPSLTPATAFRTETATAPVLDRLRERLVTLSNQGDGCSPVLADSGAGEIEDACIGGYLWDSASVDESGPYAVGGDEPCPVCNHARWLARCEPVARRMGIEAAERGEGVETNPYPFAARFLSDGHQLHQWWDAGWTAYQGSVIADAGALTYPHVSDSDAS